MRYAPLPDVRAATVVFFYMKMPSHLLYGGPKPFGCGELQFTVRAAVLFKRLVIK